LILISHAHRGMVSQDSFSYVWPAINRVPGKRTPWPVARSSSLLSKAQKAKPLLPTPSRRLQELIMLTYDGLNRWVRAGDGEASWLGGSVIEGGAPVLFQPR
jgi:hypothetical protein